MADLTERLAGLSPAKRQFLERRLQQLMARQPHSSIPARRQDQPAPLSFSQQGFWMQYELHPGVPLHHHTRALRLRGPLDVEALRHAYTHLVQRQEILRTIFPVDDGGERVQVVLDSPQFDLPQVDLRAEADLEAALAQRIEALAQRPFDLVHDLPLRAVLYQLGAEGHVLCQVHHHIASDFWSAGILRRELSALYGDYVVGREPSLPALPVQYADFAAWQRQQAGTEAFQRQLAYWRERLRGPLPMLALPHDHPRPPTPTYRGASVSLHLGAELWDSLQAVGRRQAATPFMVMAAACAALFHRYSGQDDLLLGMIVSGRNRPELEGVIGPFISSVVLRLDASGDPTFTGLLARVQQEALAAYDHQEAPFEHVVAEVRPERRPGAHPIVQVMLNFLNTPSSELNLADLEIEPIPVERDTSEFDLLVRLWPTLEGLTITLTYNLDLFEKSTVERMLDNFHTLLGGVFTDAETRLSKLPLLSPAETQRTLVDWNQTARPWVLDWSFIVLFQEQATRTPEAVAATAESSSISYQDLNARANRLARGLQRRGVVAGDVVALLGERGIDFLTAMLAIWKASAVYLPLDPRWPQLRRQQVLEESRVPFLLADAGHLAAGEEPVLRSPLSPPKGAVEGTAVGWQGELLPLETMLGHAEEDGDPDVLPGPGDLAYVIYTSGSTGRPKGAMVEQRGLVNHLYAKIEALSLTAEDVIAQNSPQSFDISVRQFLVGLLVGARTHIVRDEVAFDPAALLAEVEQAGVTVFESVPSLLRAILEQSSAGIALSRLRRLNAGGEALPATLSRAWFERYPHVDQMNGYGPTECSIGVTHFPLKAPPGKGDLTVPIGQPVGNARIYILDERGQPVPAGVMGEIYVGGVGVGRGYLHDPARTAAVFLPDPFSGKVGARLYRTGDLGRWRENPAGESGHYLEFMGRVDHQVKLRGQRIELEEIEYVLGEHAGGGGMCAWWCGRMGREATVWWGMWR